MAERSKALQLTCPWTGGVRVRIPLETYIFILNFSLPPRSEQVNGAVANEIKHVHSPEVIVVLDPRYDLSYKALYISTCSIALRFRFFTAIPYKKYWRGFPSLETWWKPLVNGFHMVFLLWKPLNKFPCSFPLCGNYMENYLGSFHAVSIAWKTTWKLLK